MHPVDPPSPDYVPRPEEPEQAPLSPDYVPGTEYSEYLAPYDDEIPIEDQPYATAASPDGPMDYPADEGDDDDDESFGDDADDKDEEEASEEDEEEEEHLAPADSTAASPVVDPVPSAEETEPFETEESVATPPPPPAYRTTARMSIRSQAPIPFLSEIEVDRLLAIPTPPPNPLTPLSSPLPQIPSPPFPVPSPSATSPTYVKAPLGFRAVGIRLGAASPLPSPPLPPPSSPLLPPVDHREDIPEADIPPRKRLCMTALTPRFEVRESSTAAAARQPGLGVTRTNDYGFVDMVSDAPRRHVPREVRYGITDIWDKLVDAIQEGAPTTLEGVNARVTKLAETYERDTQDIYAHLEDAQDSRARLSGRVDILLEDRHAAVHYELQAYRAHTHIQDLRISSQEALTATLVAQVSSLQSQLIAALGQIQALQARDPAHADDPEDADSSSMAVELVFSFISVSNHHKMASGRGTRTTPTTATATTTTPMTDAAIRALIAQGVDDSLGTEGVVGLTRWFERMNFVFHISNCAVENQVKFTTCTLHGIALTWWNTYVKTIGHDAAYGMPWKTLMKMMTANYTQRFQELALMSRRMFPEYSDVLEKYVGGLPDVIQGNVMSTKPKTMEEAVEMANNLIDQKLSGPSEKREYSESLPKCSKCNYHHNGPCVPKCHKCNKVGHLARDCRSSRNANTGNNQRATRANQKGTGCYECGAQGHFKRECPKLKNKNRGNQGGNGNAPTKVYVVGYVG
ncbi:putative reverse transcriptase domain-containing protein [Tanacetum coccineum]